MNNQRNHEPGRRHSAAIRFTTVRPHADRVEFHGTGDDGEQHVFSIAADTLRALSREEAPPGDLMPIFEQRKPSIFAVASRAFNAGVGGAPHELPPGGVRGR
jgi:hypothetical protein